MQETGPSGRITLISHAPTEAVRRAAFPLDEPLEPAESAKLKALGWIPPRASQIQTAPEQRTRLTVDALGLDATVAIELRDLDYGSWGGISLEDVQARDPAGLSQWLTEVAVAPHGGESIAALFSRAEDWLGQRKDCGHTIAVTHSSFIRAAIALTLLAPVASFWRIEIAPLSITDLRWSGYGWKLRSAGVKLSGDRT